MTPASITWGSCAHATTTTTAQDRVCCGRPITSAWRAMLSEPRNAARPSTRQRARRPLAGDVAHLTRTDLVPLSLLPGSLPVSRARQSETAVGGGERFLGRGGEGAPGLPQRGIEGTRVAYATEVSRQSWHTLCLVSSPEREGPGGDAAAGRPRVTLSLSHTRALYGAWTHNRSHDPSHA